MEIYKCKNKIIKNPDDGQNKADKMKKCKNKFHFNIDKKTK